MDGKERFGSEILKIGKCIQELFRKELCPDFVRDTDLVMLSAPWEEADYRVGIYLYDIQDYSLMQAGETPAGDRKRRYPPKAVELSYMIFCNEARRFGGTQREQTHIVLNEIIRTIHDNPVIQNEDGEKVQVSFLQESVEFKIRLWGSFDKPLQPAVYIKAVPVLIHSQRMRSVSKVKEIDMIVNEK